jgi:uroporphyrinogen-III synthase
MLAGRRIVITREHPGELADRLREHGAIPIHLPLIQIAPILPNPPLEEALSRLHTFEWAIFTSANAVRYTIRPEHLAEWRRLKIAAVGNKTAAALRRFSIDTQLIPPEQNAAALSNLLDAQAHILIPQAEQPANDFKFPNAEKIAVYRTVSREPTPDQLAEWRRGVDAITFASPSAVRAFLQYLSPTLPESVKIVCIGTTTAQAAASAGLTVHAVAAQPSSDGMIAALTSVL